MALDTHNCLLFVLFLFEIQADVWEPMPFLIYGVFGVASGLMMLTMPETRGRLLAQTIEETVQTLR